MELPVVAIKEPQLVDGRAESAGTQKRRPKNNVQLEDGKISSIQSEHVASAAFIFGVLFCIIIIKSTCTLYNKTSQQYECKKYIQ